MLVIIIVLHQTIDRAIAKVNYFPLRRIYLRFVEFFGRIFCFPAVTVLYIISMEEISDHSHLIMVLITAVIVTCILIPEWTAFKQEIRRGLDEFIIKLNDPYTKFADISNNEIIFFNAWRLHILSVSTAYMEEMLIEHGCIVGPPSWGIFDDHTKERKQLEEGIKEHHLLEPAFVASGIAAAEEAKHGEESLIHSHRHHHHHHHHKNAKNHIGDETKDAIIVNESRKLGKKSPSRHELVVQDDERVVEATGHFYSIERVPSLCDSYFEDSGGLIGHQQNTIVHL
jgi:hypothetical protein